MAISLPAISQHNELLVFVSDGKTKRYMTDATHDVVNTSISEIAVF